MRSAIFSLAAQQWKAMRDDYQSCIEAAYERAETACNGVLLNQRGKSAGIDPYSLFMGTDTRARAYASRELLDHWDQHPRMTVSDFERQWLDYSAEHAA